MLIDDVTIKVKAGRGGDGAVNFNNTKMSLGPVGANGGRGGNVYLEGVSDIGALIQFRRKKALAAEDGQKGRTQLKDGADGRDLILKVPIGTVARNLSTGKDVEIVSVGQRFLATRGGRGGQGNFKFRSSVNTSPTEFSEGLAGEECELRLELKLIADVGFVGLPNVGKSSLLNRLTNAKSKVANYPFTTLDPNLGAYYELILADIPGLIEGASGGKGLGVKFLRHIERVKILFHFISAQSPDPARDYQIIRNELGAYNKELLDKPEYLFLSKADLLDKNEIDEKIRTCSALSCRTLLLASLEIDELKTMGREVIPVSITDDESISRVKEVLSEIIKQKAA